VTLAREVQWAEELEEVRWTAVRWDPDEQEAVHFPEQSFQTRDVSVAVSISLPTFQPSPIQ
jgi:hypothetical protein